jgi:hypothetical protein
MKLVPLNGLRQGLQCLLAAGYRLAVTAVAQYVARLSSVFFMPARSQYKLAHEMIA